MHSILTKIERQCFNRTWFICLKKRKVSQLKYFKLQLKWQMNRTQSVFKLLMKHDSSNIAGRWKQSPVLPGKLFSSYSLMGKGHKDFTSNTLSLFSIYCNSCNTKQHCLCDIEFSVTLTESNYSHLEYKSADKRTCLRHPSIYGCSLLAWTFKANLQPMFLTMITSWKGCPFLKGKITVFFVFQAFQVPWL